ncbi:MAG TPA: 1-(5-phosphoribosyl)-5-[(5-phosphoribosylamino)methylideneamino]imidazole-4-carboxamide isomerase [Candidatus Sphingobacterium stercoripullorum]|nr:1-(5-phosphoribosyl)-5-[(5-phosphoribosylamino)methylideneamino]imidazole-4-carboxamide isomerase [Candidatus Sphingobacterium stercoripullorum]
MRIIPAIDIIGGKCVRLSKGDYNTKKIYSENPLEIAKAFEDNGIEYLHVVDLDGAKAQQIVHYKILEEICTKTNLKVDFGGGLKSDQDLKIAFESGANQITGGSIAVKQPEVFKAWLKKYGNEKIILGADCKDRKIATNAWTELAEIDVLTFISIYEKEGASYVICTDISKDGMLAGTSNELYAEILENTNVKLIASGGVSCIEDLYLLQDLGCEGAILGKAFYEGKITLSKLEKFINETA